MTQIGHKIYLVSLTLITLVALVVIGYLGFDYYQSDLDQRFFHALNDDFKPSGLIGHGLGVIGSLMMIVGVFGYMLRKRSRSLARLGILKHWLEFHIFLCVLGPILVVYHTSFKFGGIVAISFWCMVAVVISGIIGRVIYLQIPRTIEGREMSLNELNIKKAGLNSQIQQKFDLNKELMEFLNRKFNAEMDFYKGSFFSKVVKRFRFERKLLQSTRAKLTEEHVTKSNRKRIIKYLRAEIVLSRRIAWLTTMQNYLKYWHVIHLPFALGMLVIMIVHVVVALLFGYHWIF